MDNHRFECMVSCLQNCYSCCRFLIIPDIQGSKTNLSLLTSKKSIRKARVTHLLEAVIHSGPMFKYFKKFPYCKSFDTLSDLSNTDIDRLMLSASLDITSTTDIGPTRKSRHSHHRVWCNPWSSSRMSKKSPAAAAANTGGYGGGGGDDDHDCGPSGPIGEERQGQHLHQCTTGE